MALVRRSSLTTLFSDMLATKVYVPCAVEGAHAFVRDTVNLAQRIGKHADDAALPAVLLQPLHRSGSSCNARLRLTVKTHKPEGKVVCRAVHASCGYALEGVARWISHELRPHLAKCEHLLVDAKQLKDAWANLRTTDSMRLALVDVKDFFYSGSHPEIVRDATAFGNCPEVFSDALMHCLRHQYVGSDAVLDPGNAHRVIRGTGMGLQHSADVMDSCFAFNGEKWAVTDTIRRKYQIHGYKRYRDDLIIVYGNQRLFDIWLHMLRLKSPYFRLEVEAVDQRCVKYLDLRVALEGGGVVFAYDHKKNLGPPLALSSGHPSGSHSWRNASVRRFFALSTYRKDASIAAQEYLDRFRRFGIFPLPPLVPGVRNVAAKSIEDTGWVPVSYHPLLRGPLNRCLAEFLREYRLLTESLFMRGVLGVKATMCKIAWRNMLPHLSIRLRRY